MGASWRHSCRTLLVLLMLWPASVLHAVEPDEILTDAGLETRARRLSAELRCLVCQNQSIDDSNAPLARDLRLIVRERLTAGDSDDAVLNFIVARYGAFVLLKPPLTPGTVLLWMTPLLLLGAVGLLVAYRLRQSREPTSVNGTALTDDERRRLATILARDAAHDPGKPTP